MRIIFAGGGTAGHINPALAIANYIKHNENDFEALFVGTKGGMEATLVPQAGYDIRFVEVQGFKRSLSPENIKAVFKAAAAILKCRKIIKDFKPDIVIGTGGYVSGPLVSAAAGLKILTLIHEQNVFAGMTSKMLSGKVDTVCISFEESKKAFPKAKNIVHTGNPLRPELFDYTKEKAREALNIGNRPFVVAFGGSLGAEKLNEAVLGLVKKSCKENKFSLLFGTGKRGYDDVYGKFKNMGIMSDDIKIVPYIDNMQEVMNAADLVIARAGAVTLSEINALGKAAILIPSPNVTDNHQEFNARALEKNGAAVVITEDMLEKEDIMYHTVSKLLQPGKLDVMSANSRKMGIKDGTEKIYEEVKKLIK